MFLSRGRILSPGMWLYVIWTFTDVSEEGTASTINKQAASRLYSRVANLLWSRAASITVRTTFSKRGLLCLLVFFFDPEDEDILSPETSVNLYYSSLCHIPECSTRLWSFRIFYVLQLLTVPSLPCHQFSCDLQLTSLHCSGKIFAEYECFFVHYLPAHWVTQTMG